MPGKDQTRFDDSTAGRRGRHGVPAVARGHAGFTLVELMVTLAVAAILAMIAVPSFKRVLVSTHLSDINNAIASDLQYARTEAISRQTTVAVAASAGDWQNGWTVRIPPASSTGTAVRLRSHAAIPAQQYVVSGPAASVSYRAQGSPGAAACFTISEYKGKNSTPRFLQVSAVGLLQQTTSTTTPSGCTAPST